MTAGFGVIACIVPRSGLCRLLCRETASHADAQGGEMPAASHSTIKQWWPLTGSAIFGSVVY